MTGAGCEVSGGGVTVGLEDSVSTAARSEDVAAVASLVLGLDSVGPISLALAAGGAEDSVGNGAV